MIAANPDQTAIRVALWRALHLRADEPPYVLEDELALKIAGPTDDWRKRPDMDAKATMRARASIIARARFLEDFVAEQCEGGIGQYVILGAGLDTFALRRPRLAARMTVFELDRPGPQEWKRDRFKELALAVPERLRLVPIDMLEGASWRAAAAGAGFDPAKPAVVSAAGLVTYLRREFVAALLKEAAALPAGSTLAMTYMLPIDLVEAEEQPSRSTTEKNARMSGTPFLSLFAPDEVLALAKEAGFKDVRRMTPKDLAERYFDGRSDGLRPSSAEELLIATT